MKERVKKEIIGWIKSIAIALTISFLITQVIKLTVVSGESMKSTLEDKDYLIANRLAYKFNDIERGDIIIFNSNRRYEDGSEAVYVKRVIATEGDHIIIKNSSVYVNGEEVDEYYLDENCYTEGNVDYIVPENHIYVLGDNRENSEDSRSSTLGAVEVSEIIGRIELRIWPLNAMGKLD